jgi:hypothetical protein
LPGRDHAGRLQDRHHAGLHPQAGRDRRRVRGGGRSPTRRCISSPSSDRPSTCVGIGGDPVTGRASSTCSAVQRRSRHRGVILIGEIGGSARKRPRSSQAEMKAGTRVHRRPDRPKGQAMGTRRIIAGGKAPADKIAALSAAGRGMAPAGRCSGDDATSAREVRIMLGEDSFDHQAGRRRQARDRPDPGPHRGGRAAHRRRPDGQLTRKERAFYAVHTSGRSSAACAAS